jgi:hypothetical protein
MPTKRLGSRRRPQQMMKIVLITLAFSLVVGVLSEGVRVAVDSFSSSNARPSLFANAASTASVVMLVPLLLSINSSHGLFETFLPDPIYTR